MFITHQQTLNSIKNGTFATLGKKIAVGEEEIFQMLSLNAIPTKDYIIERFGITPGNLTLLCATGHSGKTMLAQYIALCILNNKKLFNRFDVKSGQVVHIDQEQSKNQSLIRYVRLANAMGVGNIGVNRVRLEKRLDDSRLNLSDVQNELVHLCSGKTICIIDSLKKITCADENSADIEIVLNMLKNVAEITNCAILCIHHKGKGKDAKQSGRGHSSIYDSCDVQIDLQTDQLLYEITCAKNRDGKFFDGIKYTISDTGDWNENQKCTEKLTFELLCNDIKSTKQTQQERIIEVLQNSVQIKYNDLFTLVRGDRKGFRETLDAMIQSDQLCEFIGPRNSKIYQLKK